jgi:hypothetical protein
MADASRREKLGLMRLLVGNVIEEMSRDPKAADVLETFLCFLDIVSEEIEKDQGRDDSTVISFNRHLLNRINGAKDAFSDGDIKEEVKNDGDGRSPSEGGDSEGRAALESEEEGQGGKEESPVYRSDRVEV